MDDDRDAETPHDPTTGPLPWVSARDMEGLSRPGSGDALPFVIGGIFALVLAAGLAAFAAAASTDASSGSNRVELIAFLNALSLGIAVCGGVLIAGGLLAGVFLRRP